MKVEKNELKKSQIELNIEIEFSELKKYIPRAVENISKEVKIDGFRKGKVPYEILKQKIGEMAILEEVAKIIINKTIGEAIEKNIDKTPVGQPQVDIVKLAPNNPLVYKVKLALMPELKLGTYKDLKIKKQQAVVEEKEVDGTMEELRNMRVKEVIKDGDAKDGDKVLIDIQMFLDNVPVEGGQGKNTAIVIGKNYILPGFDKNLIGCKKSDIKEFSLVYPKEHYMKNLSGKRVDFKVNVLDVYERQLPELDDEFAKSLGFKKIDELKNNLKKNILEEKESKEDIKAEREMLDKIIDKSAFDEIPEILIEHEVKTMISELEHNIIQQGAKFDDYLKSINKTYNQLTMDLLPDAMKRVKVSLAIKEISKVEAIKAEDKELEKHIDEMKKHYLGQQDIIGKIESQEYKTYTLNILTSEKVVKKLKEWNIVD